MISEVFVSYEEAVPSQDLLPLISYLHHSGGSGKPHQPAWITHVPRMSASTFLFSLMPTLVMMEVSPSLALTPCKRSPASDASLLWLEPS